MKKSITKRVVIFLAFLGLCKFGFAGVNEFAEKVNGDIYGQTRVIGDVDGDGCKDIIFGATDGKVHLFSSTGKEIFRPPYWPKQVDSPITAGIEVADLDGNGNQNILVSTMEGTLYCLNSTGKELWKYKTGGKILISTPVVTDMEGTGKHEIFVNSGSGHVARLGPNGVELQVLTMDHSVQATPVTVDLNKNGVKDIIIKDNSGKISIFNELGVETASWMVGRNSNSEWPFNLDASDIDGDGIPEIYSTDPTGNGGVFTMWDPEGKVISSFKLSDAAHGAPKVADMDGDGIDDFIIAQADGKVLVCDKNGKVKKGWPYTSDYSIYSSPTIIDIDGDGKNEIVFTANDEKGKDERAGCIVALNREGKMVEGFPKYIGKTIAPLTFADLDNDGSMEIIAAGGIGYTGPQIHVIRTKTNLKFKIVTLRQETEVR